MAKVKSAGAKRQGKIVINKKALPKKTKYVGPKTSYKVGKKK